MKIRFCLAWYKSGKPLRSAFKDPNAQNLFEEYVKRIRGFVSCEVSEVDWENPRQPGTLLWVCERAGVHQKAAGTAEAISLSSEELAAKLSRAADAGTRQLNIVIGRADGFSVEEIEKVNPDFFWSFGRLVLPHELATVVAAEQIYRAWTILRRMPYHTGH